MHILVTNDDGPPSTKASPYIHAFVNHLKAAGHDVSVCLPDTQRSWIGKAHMIGQTLKPVYFRPSAHVYGDETEGTTNARPDASGAGDEEWVLVDGTPASCVQIGLNHFFHGKGPVDLVVSGPNYGRNTTAIFALSSGTLGGALEAAVCKVRAIAVSFAFFSRNHDPAIIEAACRQSVKVIDGLYRQWPTDDSVDLYSVNVPLVEAVDTRKIYLTKMLQNYWQAGGCFEEIDDPSNADPVEEEAKIREGGLSSATPDTETDCRGHKHKHFKWAPRFTDVYSSVEAAGPGSDGWVVKEGHTSVTPLKANFAQANVGDGQQELNLLYVSSIDTILTIRLYSSEPAVQEQSKTLAMREKQQDSTSPDKIQAFVAYEDDYVQPLIVSALQALLPDDLVDLITAVPGSNDGTFSASRALSSPSAQALQIMPYEALDFDHAAAHPQSYLVNSYMIRKALIRKHYLSTTVEHCVAKRPDSVLATHVKRTDAFEVDYAEFLDDALVEAFDLRESLARNDALGEAGDASPPQDRAWWILKPGMSDRGQGIRLFSTMDELQAIFDGWEEDQPGTDDEEEDEQVPQSSGNKDGITTSHLRHFVAQPYIHPPLLLRAGGHKFHIRTYVLCAGSLRVYVYRPMLALFAGKPYRAPWEAPTDYDAFLTNTCLQDSPHETTVQPFWALEGLSAAAKDDVFAQVCAVTGAVVEGAARAMPIHFQPLPNAFEVFGLDFLLDADGCAWLLEVNAFPDFRQTGRDLTGIVGGFWRGVVREAVVPFFGVGEGSLLRGSAGEEEEERRDMVCVRDVDLGRR
ncbi:5 3 -nucleotidase [Cordyceps militaris]|uniref:5 3-nucleotidase n=1 Tax=Cordyceps militaris TaxID=73501 RepID=A0A2H4SUZ9_CORMI|nr:5 3 -nucleotidase [Cordyceps militaris]